MATPIYEFTQFPQANRQAQASSSSNHSIDPDPQSADQSGKLGGRARTNPSVGVIYNPRSHHNKGADLDCGMSPQIHIAQPGDREQLALALNQFAQRGIELLVINGGDGTVRDVLTCGAEIYGDTWPTLAVLPKGKTNALTVDLKVPAEWNLHHAIDAFATGGRRYRRPIQVTALGNEVSESGASRMLGFILGAGSFTTATRAAQSAHRMGAFNSVVVGVTTAWGIAQWLFASRANAWRRGARMDIRLGAQQTPMGHSGSGDPKWRQFLFASTLETMPAGLLPFGNLRKGLKMVALDQISRRSTLAIPGVLKGKSPKGLRERGIHQIGTPQFTLDIDDQFIFDGEAFPKGNYCIAQGPELEFVTP